MKKKLLLIVTMLSLMINTHNNLVYGQISTTTPASKKVVEKEKNNDSTRNFLGKDVDLYIGQELYVRPLSDIAKIVGYTRFKKTSFKNTSSSSSGYAYGVKSKNENVTPYDSVANKIFIVENVEEAPNMYPKYIFLLRNKDTGMKCKYIYDSSNEYSFDFYLIGYYEKMLKVYKDKVYYIADNVVKSYDLYTGEPIKKSEKNYQKWTITGLTIESEYGSLVAVINNGEQNSYIALRYLEPTSYKKKVYSEIDWMLYCHMYGVEMCEMAIKGSVVVGMPTKLVEFSWGKPNKINRSSNGPDQWCYTSQYLYIEDGIVKSWN